MSAKARVTIEFDYTNVVSTKSLTIECGADAIGESIGELMGGASVDMPRGVEYQLAQAVVSSYCYFHNGRESASVTGLVNAAIKIIKESQNEEEHQNDQDHP